MVSSPGGTGRPSWPLSLSPQHVTTPDASTAHACPLPHARSTASVTPGINRGATCVGAAASGAAPASVDEGGAPDPLPQHMTAPSASRAHDVSKPAHTA